MAQRFSAHGPLSAGSYAELSGQQFDLVICDLKMPRLDGQSFYRTLEEANPDLAHRVIFVTGDLNVSYRRDKIVQDRLFPYYNMRQVGVRASYDVLGEPVRGTHILDSGNDTRVIDYVDYLVHPKVTPAKQSVLLGYASDHRPVLVRFDIASSL